jgi:signal transduction histidine kinase
VPEAYGGYAEAIGSSGRHLLTAIDEILMASHLELGDSKLEERSLRLDEIVAASVHALLPDAASARIEIDMAQAREPLSVIGDAQALRLTLRHILSNAINATGAGGKVSVGYKLDRESDGALWLDLWIGDHSIDLKTAKRSSSQTSYPIGHAYLATARGGLQFGLDIARRFMELHGGQLIIASKNDAQGEAAEEVGPVADGTAVILRLPGERLRHLPATEPMAAAD